MTRPLDERFRDQADQCAEHGSPLTAALLHGAADELDRPGPVRDLLAPLADDAPGSVPSLRFAGALHRLVLERRAPGLALHYPSVGGTAGPAGAWAAAREVVAAEPRLAELVQPPVQTNEVGRTAVLYGALLALTGRSGLPVRLLEVGASAGLNLRPEAVAYEVGSEVLGDPASPVRLVQPWVGRPVPEDRPPGVVRVASRAGCDPAPLDPTTTAGRLTLTSYVWGDQVDRLERLRGAFALAERVPATVERAPASAFLERELAEPVAGVLTVVWHSLVWQYFSTQERASVDRLLEAAGARATAEAPLARLALEPERLDGSFRFTVVASTWPGGVRRRLATAEGHGPPVRWEPRT